MTKNPTKCAVSSDESISRIELRFVGVGFPNLFVPPRKPRGFLFRMPTGTRAAAPANGEEATGALVLFSLG